MKAVVIKEAGGPEKLVYQDVPTPSIKPGWSLVRVRGFGINHSEIFTRKGLSPTVKFPRILGIECVGTVEKTSDPVRLPIGQKVVSIMGEIGRAFDGSYAEFTLLPNDQIYPVHTSIDWATLAAIPETYYTAYGSLLNLRLSDDDLILVRGGSSGVGIAFLNLAKALHNKIRIIGTTRHSRKVKDLLSVGYDDVILDHGGKLQTKKQFSKILELIGPATVKDSFRHLKEDGIVCSTGELGNQWYLQDFDPITDLAPNSYLTSFYSGNVDNQKLNDLLAVIEKNQVTIKPTKIFQLDQVPAAHRFLESSHSLGKVIVLNN